jgi:predicted Zn-dependent protease
MLRNDWPFVPSRRHTALPTPADGAEEIAQRWFTGQISWAAAMNEALAWYQAQGNDSEAARVAANLADAFVNSPEPQYAAGRLLLKAGEPARGQHYLARAVALDGSKPEYRLSQAQSQFMQGRTADAVATLETALLKHPDDERIEYWLEEMRRDAPRVISSPQAARAPAGP